MDAVNIEISIIESFRLLLKDLGFPWAERCYLLNRLQNEGLPFLNKTLPNFWKSVLNYIEDKTSKLSTAFNLKSSSLRRWRLELSNENIEPSFLWQISTICNYYYKLSLPFDSETLRSYTDNYISCQLEGDQEQNVDAYVSDFIEDVRKTVEKDYGLHNFMPDEWLKAARHGSGSVICDIAGVSPQAFKDSFDGRYPKGHKAFSGIYRYRATDIYTAKPRYLRESSRPDYYADYCEVLFVPKDARGPRVISKESVARAKLSLGFHDCIKRRLEIASNGCIQFTDQTIFQGLAKQGSLDGSFATLDLSEASDRHRIRIARRIYRNIPGIRYALNLCRATNYKIIDRDTGSERTGKLTSVAGMGNGLTFPLMALTIHATAVTALRRHGFHAESKKVYVYGDDIIVPNNVYNIVVNALQMIGFKVNLSKSFHLGKFRESCGGDYYNGVSVTPVRFKQTFCDNFVTKDLKIKPDKTSKDPYNSHKFITKLEAHCRNLVDAGLTGLAEYYYRKIEYSIRLVEPKFRLGVTDDIQKDGLNRYDPFVSRQSQREPFMRFVSLHKRGNYNRLIRSKLGGENQEDNLQSWLVSKTNRVLNRTVTELKRFSLLFYNSIDDALAIICKTGSFEHAPVVQMYDTKRYSGCLVKV